MLGRCLSLLTVLLVSQGDIILLELSKEVAAASTTFNMYVPTSYHLATIAAILTTANAAHPLAPSASVTAAASSFKTVAASALSGTPTDIPAIFPSHFPTSLPSDFSLPSDIPTSFKRPNGLLTELPSTLPTSLLPDSKSHHSIPTEIPSSFPTNLPTDFSLPGDIPTSFKTHPTQTHHTRSPKPFTTHGASTAPLATPSPTKPTKPLGRYFPRAALKPPQSFTQVIQYILNPTSASLSSTTYTRPDAGHAWTLPATSTDYRLYTPTPTTPTHASATAGHCYPTFTLEVANSKTPADGASVKVVHSVYDLDGHYFLGLAERESLVAVFAIDDTPEGGGHLFRKPVDAVDRVVANIDTDQSPNSVFRLDPMYRIVADKSSALSCRIGGADSELMCSGPGGRSVFGFWNGQLGLWKAGDVPGKMKEKVQGLRLLVRDRGCKFERPTSPSVSTYPGPPAQTG